MIELAIDLFVQGGMVSAAAVGLGLHLRLVRFFDLTWALWATGAAITSVIAFRTTHSLAIAVLSAAALCTALGAVESLGLLRKVLFAAIPRELLERSLFSAALAAYIALAGISDALGFRSQEMISSTSTLGRVPMPSIAAATACWSALAAAYILRMSQAGLRLRAALDDISASRLLGLQAVTLGVSTGAVSGALTGAAAGSFGILYFAHFGTGFSLMLLAATPCLIVGMSNSRSIVVAALLTVTMTSLVRYLFGYAAAELLMPIVLLALLVYKPEGLAVLSPRKA